MAKKVPIFIPPKQPRPGTPSKTPSEVVRYSLLDRILQGILMPGQSIRVKTLVQEFAVSAAHVREALRELVAVGVLEVAESKGIFVRQMCLKETLEAFEIRASLESMAFRQAPAKVRSATRRLRVLASKIVTCARQGDLNGYQEQNQEFHRTILAASGNHLLLKLWESVVLPARIRVTLPCVRQLDPMPFALAHLEIVEALAQADDETVLSLLGSHSNRVVDFLKNEMKVHTPQRN